MPAIPAPSLQVRDPEAGGRAAGLIGLGAFLPDGRLTNADLEQMVRTSDAWIMERTGIRERRRAGSGLTASVMGAEAGQRAMEAAGVAAVDAIIVATCTGDTAVPSTACLVQRRLGLAGVPAFDVNAACSGWLYGLVLARSMIATAAAHSVLVIGTEALTSLVDYTDRTTCVLFGDGAGAAVVAPVTTGAGIAATRWRADGTGADLIYYGTPEADADAHDGIRMAGSGTFRLAVERLTEVARNVCADAGWDPAEIDLVVPHQANLRIIEAVTKRLGIPMARVMTNIERVGNTSAASIPLALAEADAAGRLHEGNRLLLIAFGAGVTWAGAAVQWGGATA